VAAEAPGVKVKECKSTASAVATRRELTAVDLRLVAMALPRPSCFVVFFFLHENFFSSTQTARVPYVNDILPVK